MLDIAIPQQIAIAALPIGVQIALKFADCRALEDFHRLGIAEAGLPDRREMVGVHLNLVVLKILDPNRFAQTAEVVAQGITFAVETGASPEDYKRWGLSNNNHVSIISLANYLDIQ